MTKHKNQIRPTHPIVDALSTKMIRHHTPTWLIFFISSCNPLNLFLNSHLDHQPITKPNNNYY